MGDTKQGRRSEWIRKRGGKRITTETKGPTVEDAIPIATSKLKLTRNRLFSFPLISLNHWALILYSSNLLLLVGFDVTVFLSLQVIYIHHVEEMKRIRKSCSVLEGEYLRLLVKFRRPHRTVQFFFFVHFRWVSFWFVCNLFFFFALASHSFVLLVFFFF